MSIGSIRDSGDSTRTDSSERGCFSESNGYPCRDSDYDKVMSRLFDSDDDADVNVAMPPTAPVTMPTSSSRAEVISPAASVNTLADSLPDPTLVVGMARSYIDMVGVWYGITAAETIVDCPSFLQYALDVILRNAAKARGELDLAAISEVVLAAKRSIDNLKIIKKKVNQYLKIKIVKTTEQLTNDR